MDSFHVVLPSNTNTPGNKTTDYLVRLPNTIDLSEGTWAVALSSIIYPVTFGLDLNEPMEITIYYDPKTGRASRKYQIPEPATTFMSIRHFEDTINGTLLDTNLKTNEKSKEVSSKVHHPLVHAGWEGLTGGIIPIRQKRDTKKKTFEKISDTADEQNKELNQAKREFLNRSLPLIIKTIGEIDDLSTEVERLSARVERVIDLTQPLIIPYEEMSQSEANHLKQQINDFAITAGKTRAHAQQTRSSMKQIEWFRDREKEFDEQMKQKNIANVKKLASQARDIWVPEKNKEKEETFNDFIIVQNLEKEINLFRQDVIDAVTPTEEGMKHNIDRVKNEILSLIPTNNSNLEIFFHYDANLGKFFLYNHKPTEIVNVGLSPTLAKMMGFEINEKNMVRHIRMHRGGGFAKYTADVTTDIHQLYVYLPEIVEPNYVGDSLAPLLRIVNVGSQYVNQYAESVFPLEYFVKIIQKRITAIRVYITGSDGKLLKFRWGDVICVLHFKRIYAY